jgi:hypothetical protein
MLDATSDNLGQGDNGWGVSFRTSDNTFINNNLRITQILIDLDPDNNGDMYFDFSSSSPILSDNSIPYKVRDNSGNSQPDNFGFIPDGVNRPQGITFSPTTGTSSTLLITFTAVAPDTGFNPGDRFRFGANARVQRGGGGSFATADGDDVGQRGAKVTVTFQLGATTSTGEGTFFDNPGKKNDCFDPGVWVTDDLGNNHLVVNPLSVVDLPCPETSASKNNKQSYVTVGGSGANAFAVRAQATIEVPSLCCLLCGIPIGPYSVCTKTTAMYACTENRPRLIRLAEYTCEVIPPPTP